MFHKRIKSFLYAINGIIHLVRHEPHARFHLLATVAVVGAGFYFNVSANEWCTLCLSIGLVFSAEGFNTAIERLTDLASPEQHPLAGQAKDVAAGAVLLASIAALVVGIIVFFPRIISIYY